MLLQEEDDVSLSSTDSREGLEEDYSASGDSDFDVRAQSQRGRRPGRRPGALSRGQQARAEETGTGRRAHLARRRVPSRRLRDEDRSGGGGRQGLRKRRRLRYTAEASDVDMSLSDEEMGSEEDLNEVRSYSQPFSFAIIQFYLPRPVVVLAFCVLLPCVLCDGKPLMGNASSRGSVLASTHASYARG